MRKGSRGAHRPLDSFPVTVFVTREDDACGKMGVSVGTEERVKMPFFKQDTEEGAWRLMSVRRTIHNKTGSARYER